MTQTNVVLYCWVQIWQHKKTKTDDNSSSLMRTNICAFFPHYFVILGHMSDFSSPVTVCKMCLSLWRITRLWWQTLGFLDSWLTTNTRRSCLRGGNCLVWRSRTVERGTQWWETLTGWLLRWSTVWAINCVILMNLRSHLSCHQTILTIEVEIEFSVLFSGKSYDERVDIFSFGIMLCEVRNCHTQYKWSFFTVWSAKLIMLHKVPKS